MRYPVMNLGRPAPPVPNLGQASRCDQITGLLERYNCQWQEWRQKFQPPPVVYNMPFQPPSNPAQPVPPGTTSNPPLVFGTEFRPPWEPTPSGGPIVVQPPPIETTGFRVVYPPPPPPPGPILPPPPPNVVTGGLPNRPEQPPPLPPPPPGAPPVYPPVATPGGGGPRENMYTDCYDCGGEGYVKLTWFDAQRRPGCRRVASDKCNPPAPPIEGEPTVMPPEAQPPVPSYDPFQRPRPTSYVPPAPPPYYQPIPTGTGMPTMPALPGGGPIPATPSVPTMQTPATTGLAPLPSVPMAPTGGASVVPAPVETPSAPARAGAFPGVQEATQNPYSWNRAAGLPTPGAGGVPSCPQGQFWDGTQCRGAVGNMPSIPGGGEGGGVAAPMDLPMPQGMTAGSTLMGFRGGLFSRPGFLPQVRLAGGPRT